MKGLIRNSKLAVLTLFALPLPVIAALISVQCSGAGFADPGLAGLTETSDSLLMNSSPVAAGQAITRLVVSPAAVTGGGNSTGTISLRYPAAAGGIVVTLHSDGPADVTLPRRVVIPENRSSATFAISSK